MIYYNNKAPLPSYRPEVRLPRIPDRIHPVLYTPSATKDIQAVPKVVEKKDLAKWEQTRLNKYRKTLVRP
jgi:hypothetical protein